MSAKRNELLNIAEAFAAFLVVCIHFPVPGNGEVTAIARIAVPLFFCISGYFFYRGNAELEYGCIPRKCKRLVLLLLGSELTYFFPFTPFCRCAMWVSPFRPRRMPLRQRF